MGWKKVQIVKLYLDKSRKRGCEEPCVSKVGCQVVKRDWVNKPALGMSHLKIWESMHNGIFKTLSAASWVNC